MNTYLKRVDYRKIYQTHYGPIPEGYEIHHIDGNRSNNDPTNLTAVTPQEHYDIHYAQGDFGACYLIAQQRLGKSFKEIGRLSSLHQRKLVAEGRHSWLGTGNPAYKLYAEGKHPFQNSDVQRLNAAKSNKKQMEAGTHPNQQYWTCPHCNKSSKGSGNYVRWHGDKCKLNPALLKPL